MDTTSARLLVVDDNASIRRVVRLLLEALGFVHVDEAVDGRAALDAFRRTPYDVIVTDWNMPRLGGRQLLEAVRRAPQRADTPVVVMTADGSPQRQRSAREAGADDFVTKPFVMPALGDAVQRLVADRAPATPRAAAGAERGR